MATNTLARPAEMSPRFPVGLAVGLVLALLLGLSAYALGARRGSAGSLTGRAHIGDRMASIEHEGWFYGVSDSVAWIDTMGSFHEDGWPACLRPAGSTRIVRFGAVPVNIPDSVGFRPVVWIDCRAD